MGKRGGRLAGRLFRCRGQRAEGGQGQLGSQFWSTFLADVPLRTVLGGDANQPGANARVSVPEVAPASPGWLRAPASFGRLVVAAVMLILMSSRASKTR
jgi:hypothetical protein